MRYSAVLFDLDGTLLDTLGDLHSAVNFALKKHGYAPRSLEEIRSFVGNGVRRLVQRALPEGIGEDVLERCLADFTAEYDRHMNMYTHPYDGVCDVLHALQDAGVRVAVVSNKYDSAAKALVRAHFGDLVHFTIGTLENVPAKPAPDTARTAMQALGADANATAYVGDSGVDCQTAAAAGLPFFAVDWGFWDYDRLAGAGAGQIFSDAGSLLRALQG